MSYSFTVKAANKTELKLKCAEEMGRVVTGQSSHVADQAQAIAAMSAYIDILPDLQPDEDVIVAVSGSLSGHWKDGVITRINSASISLNATLRLRDPQ